MEVESGEGHLRPSPLRWSGDFAPEKSGKYDVQIYLPPWLSGLIS